jgi:hypothetical protein
VSAPGIERRPPTSPLLADRLLLATRWPGALEEVMTLAGRWFADHLAAGELLLASASATRRVR